ncbi:MAG: transcriptional regulator [Chloroflexi bacterium]|nr:transcriptional regulator [Chloroflexota bacterium]
MASIRMINNDADLDAALERIGELLGCRENSPEEAELLALSDLVEAYEAIHYPIPEPTPAGVVQGRLDALGLYEDDLATHVGSMEVASGILAGEITISPELAESWHNFLGIPVEDLLPEATPSPG